MSNQTAPGFHTGQATDGEGTPEYLADALFDEARILAYGVRLGLGEKFDCETTGSCQRLRTFRENLRGAVDRCRRMWPMSGWRALPTFDAALAGPVTDAIESACGALMEAEDSLGDPAMTQDWVAAARAAERSLSAVFTAE